jgi:hypothetical protein
VPWALPGFALAQYRVERIELPLLHVDVTEERARKGVPLFGRFDQPLQDRIGPPELSLWEELMWGPSQHLGCPSGHLALAIGHENGLFEETVAELPGLSSSRKMK